MEKLDSKKVNAIEVNRKDYMTVLWGPRMLMVINKGSRRSTYGFKLTGSKIADTII